jgi:CRP-like cAMP-binding protein
MDRKLWYLKQCSLFEKLTPEQAARLESRALVRTFPRRSMIYTPTEPGRSVVVLAMGRVKIKDLTPDGKETILAFIEEGEMFGELAILDGEVRREYAEAVEDSKVLLIPREDLLWLMAQRQDFALAVTKLVGWRRQRIENRLRNVLFLPSRERLIRLLRELSESHGDRAGVGCTIRLPLSHQDLASLIGVTRETVTAVLGQLQAAGLVQVRRKRVAIVDCQRLWREASDSGAALPAARRDCPKL